MISVLSTERSGFGPRGQQSGEDRVVLCSLCLHCVKCASLHGFGPRGLVGLPTKQVGGSGGRQVSSVTIDTRHGHLGVFKKGWAI